MGKRQAGPKVSTFLAVAQIVTPDGPSLDGLTLLTQKRKNDDF